MTINQPSLDVEPEELDRVEELVRYLAAHDGRMPTDDMPLAWWLVETLEQPRSSPVRTLLDGIPLRDISTPLSPKRVDTWVKFIQRLDQLDLMERRGKEMEDGAASDLSKWAESTVIRYLSGKIKPAEELLLRKRPVWSFERPLSPKRRGDAVMAIGLRAIKEFHKEHGHTDVPDGVIVEGVNLRLWWQTMRDRYAGSGMKPHDRQRLESLKLDLRSDSQIAKQKAREEKKAQGAEKHAQDLERRRKAQEGTAKALAAQRRTEAALNAVRAFARQYGHTAVPVGAVTEEGLTFGRILDQWREAYAKHTLSPQIASVLKGVDRWTWRRTPASPEIQRPAPAPVPEDTTQMNRRGLRQFLPGD